MNQPLQISPCPWDTDFFGYNVGEYRVGSTRNLPNPKAIVELARSSDFRLVYLKSPVELDWSQVSSDQNAYLIDKKVTFSRTTESSKQHSEIFLFEDSVPDERMISIALQTGEYSRFGRDREFHNNEFEKLYTEWINKSVSKKIAHAVWISQGNGTQTTGLITLALKGDSSEIGLLGVDKHFRGQKLGKKLVETAISYSHSTGFNQITVATQLENEPACAFYTTLGFKVLTIEYIYHIWNSNFER